MKTIIFNIFLTVSLLFGSNVSAECIKMCNDAWWNKISSNELIEYTKNINSINIRDDYGFHPIAFLL